MVDQMHKIVCMQTIYSHINKRHRSINASSYLNKNGYAANPWNPTSIKATLLLLLPTRRSAVVLTPLSSSLGALIKGSPPDGGEMVDTSSATSQGLFHKSIGVSVVCIYVH